MDAMFRAEMLMHPAELETLERRALKAVDGFPGLYGVE